MQMECCRIFTDTDYELTVARLGILVKVYENKK